MSLYLPRWLDDVGLRGLPVRGSLVLGGSISLGESHLSGQFGDADLYHFGDADEYADLASLVRHEPRVHISHVPSEQVARLPRTYRIFELSAAGRVLSGRALDLPTITPQDLDMGDLNDIVAWRSMSIARGLEHGRGDRVAYVAAKNWLDVGIWLAGQQGLLLAGSAARIEGLRDASSGNRTLDRLTARWLDAAGAAFATKRGTRPIHEAGGPRLEDVASLLSACLEAILERKAPNAQMSDARLRRRLAIVRNQLRTKRFPSGLRGGQHRRLLSLAHAGLQQGRVLPAWETHHTIVFGGSEE